MKQTMLEPGLLRLMRVLSILHVAAILIVRRSLGARLGIEVPAGGTLLLSLAIPVFLVFFTWIPWWRQKLGQIFVPLTLALVSIDVLSDKYLTLLWLVPPDQQELELVMLMVRIWFTFHIITLLVAWQYSWVWILLTTMILSIADYVLSLPFIRSDSPLYQLFLFLFAVRTQTVTIIALGVGWLLTRQREQNAALAVANRRLAQSASTMEQLAASQERNRLARELHDTLAHSLSGVSVQLEAVQALWEVNVKGARQMLDQALQSTRSGLTEVRRALQSLRASPLEDLGLTLAVSDLAESVAARANLKLALEVENHWENIRPEVEQCIYRVAQEALTNAARHADARSLRVALMRGNAGLTLIVSDDGCGFDPAAVNGAHYGLKGLRERAEMVGAALQVESGLQQGTTVRLIVPIAEVEK
jgi:signal transduction histidine kinase